MNYSAWFYDNTKKKTTIKIDEAAVRFAEKFGMRPNICLVADGETSTQRAMRHVRSNYFYVGVEGQELPPLRLMATTGVSESGDGDVAQVGSGEEDVIWQL